MKCQDPVYCETAEAYWIEFIGYRAVWVQRNAAVSGFFRYLTIIPLTLVGYGMIDSKLGAMHLVG